MSTSMLLAIGIGALVGMAALPIGTALEVWLAARRRDQRRLAAGRRDWAWSPWMTPAEIDLLNGLDPLEAAQRAERGEQEEPELMMDPGEGLLW